MLQPSVLVMITHPTSHMYHILAGQRCVFVCRFAIFAKIIFQKEELITEGIYASLKFLSNLNSGNSLQGKNLGLHLNSTNWSLGAPHTGQTSGQTPSDT